MRTAAPQYIRIRRESDPLWVLLHRKSLGANRQHRRVRGVQLEAARLRKQTERAAQELQERKETARATAVKQKPTRLWDKAKKFFQSIGRRANYA